MRILLLSQWYVPEPDMKVHLLARGLAERGHSVTSITGFPNYPLGRIYPGYHQRVRQWEWLDGVRVLRLPLYPDHSLSSVRRAANYLSFALSASLIAPFLSGQADVMWVYHPPLTIGLPAMVLKALRGVPMVYEIQDMWPETVVASGMITAGTLARALSRFADVVYRQAAAITVISPGFKRNLISKGVPAGKIHVIPNWADEDIYRPIEPDPAAECLRGKFDGFNVVYAGNMGTAQALQTVVEAAGLLRNLPDLRFTMVGDGIEEGMLRRRADEMGLKNIEFLGRLPVDKMPMLFALADVLLLHLRKAPLFEITIPSKTLAYLGCGRPILAAISGDAADIIREAGAGLVCTPQDPEILAETVRAMYDMPRDQRESMGRAGRQTFLRNYTRRILLDRYERLLLTVAQMKVSGW